MTDFLASATFIPENGPAISVIEPSKSIAWKGVSPNSLNTDTSFWSPNEQTMSMPEPNSLFTEGWVEISTLISLPSTGSGNIAFFPMRCLYLSSSGCTTTIPQAQINSGLVVDMISSSPSSVCHLTSTSFVRLCSLSTSASAIVVPSTGS